MEQTDFLSNLDTGQPISVTKKSSPEQIELDRLLIEKNALSRDMDECAMCSTGYQSRCSSGHPQDWAILLEKIESLGKMISAE